MRLRKVADRAGSVGITGGVLVSGVLQGLTVFSFRVEIAFVAVAVVLLHAVFSSLLLTGFVGLSGLLFGLKLLRDRRNPAHTTDGGHVTAVVPVYEDAPVLDRSVTSLLDADYENLSVRIVCEPDDHATRERAAALATRERVDVFVNTDRSTTKAGAVNAAVERTDSPYVAVFDADERVHPRFLGHAVALLDEYDVVQGRTIPEPTGMLEAMAYYESVLLSYVARRLLYLCTGFRMASSRGIVMRRSAFENARGYDPTMLTEDFAFAYQCYTNRVTVRETLATPSRIQAAHSLRDWWGQRKRWMTGYAQVLHHLLGTVDPTDHRSLLSTVICAGTVVGSGLMLSLLSKFAVLLIVGAEVWFLLPVGVVYLVTLVVRLHDSRHGGLAPPGLYWIVTPALFPLYGFASIKAAVEYLLSWDGEWYAVEKH